MKSAIDNQLRMSVSGEQAAMSRSRLAQAVVQLDWRVSQLAQELALTEHQIPRVRIIIANAMARWASGREWQEPAEGMTTRDRIRVLLTPQQGEQFEALIRDEGQLLLPGE